MKFRMWFESIQTEGDKYKSPSTIITAKLMSGGPVTVTGELTLRMDGNHYSLFANYADLQKATPEFDIPMPEPRKLVDMNSLVNALHDVFDADDKPLGGGALAWKTAYDKLRELAKSLPRVPEPSRQASALLACGHGRTVWLPTTKVGEMRHCHDCGRDSYIVKIS